MTETLRKTFSALRCDGADFWSLRFVEETSASYAVRKNVPLPFAAATDRGVMASVYVDGGYGYAATSDTSPDGVRDALDRAARRWAHVGALGHAVGRCADRDGSRAAHRG